MQNQLDAEVQSVIKSLFDRHLTDQVIKLRQLPVAIAAGRLRGLDSSITEDQALRVAQQWCHNTDKPLIRDISYEMRKVIERAERSKFIVVLTLLGASQSQIATLFGIRRPTVHGIIHTRMGTYELEQAKRAANEVNIGLARPTPDEVLLYYNSWQELLYNGQLLPGDLIKAAQLLFNMNAGVERDTEMQGGLAHRVIPVSEAERAERQAAKQQSDELTSLNTKSSEMSADIKRIAERDELQRKALLDMIAPKDPLDADF